MKIWAILGARKGDNNQVLALAETLGLPFECKQLSYNRWRHFGPRILGTTFRSLTAASRAQVSGDIPDLTISTGHRSVPVVQELRRRSKGATRSIHVGYPRISPSSFDLVVATPEYPIPDHPKLMRVPFALTRKMAPVESDEAFWRSHPRPRRLLILGGPTLHWELGWPSILGALETFQEEMRSNGGSLLAVASPRTTPSLVSRVEEWFRRARAEGSFVRAGGTPTYAELLAHADSIAVTADSVAMISEAIATGKPVGLVEIRPSLTGRVVTTLLDRIRPGQRIPPRDLRFVWRELAERGLVGSPVEPACGLVPDVDRLVTERVRSILNIGNS